MVTLANWNWFSEWEKERVMKRGEAYEKVKKAIADRIWDVVLGYFPQLADKVKKTDLMK